MTSSFVTRKKTDTASSWSLAKLDSYIGSFADEAALPAPNSTSDWAHNEDTDTTWHVDETNTWYDTGKLIYRGTFDPTGGVLPTAAMVSISSTPFEHGQWAVSTAGAEIWGLGGSRQIVENALLFFLGGDPELSANWQNVPPPPTPTLSEGVAPVPELLEAKAGASANAYVENGYSTLYPGLSKFHMPTGVKDFTPELLLERIRVVEERALIQESIPEGMPLGGLLAFYGYGKGLALPTQPKIDTASPYDRVVHDLTGAGHDLLIQDTNGTTTYPVWGMKYSDNFSSVPSGGTAMFNTGPSGASIRQVTFCGIWEPNLSVNPSSVRVINRHLEVKWTGQVRLRLNFHHTDNRLQLSMRGTDNASTYVWASGPVMALDKPISYPITIDFDTGNLTSRHFQEGMASLYTETISFAVSPVTDACTSFRPTWYSNKVALGDAVYEGVKDEAHWRSFHSALRDQKNARGYTSLAGTTIPAIP